MSQLCCHAWQYYIIRLGRWLHASREKKYVRKDDRFNFIDESKAEHAARFDKIQWDNAELVQVCDQWSMVLKNVESVYIVS